MVTVNGFVAFHFNPRFKLNLVVRNTRNSVSDGSGWGKEERHGPFLFRQGEVFEIVISVESDHLKVIF